MKRICRIKQACLGLILAAGFFFSPGLRAELQFGPIETVEVPEGTEQVKISVSFTNKGTRSVRMVRIKPSCDCTVSETKEGTYPSGGGGTLDLVFKPGARVGLKNLEVLVFTDEERDKPYRITVPVSIEQVLRISPPFVYWLSGEAATAKKVEITVLQKEPVAALKCAGDSKLFTSKLTVLEKGRRYELEIRPSSTRTEAKAAFKIETDPALPGASRHAIYAFVKAGGHP